jgi:hypothetical protein
MPELPSDEVARVFFSDITEGRVWQWWRWLKMAWVQGRAITDCGYGVKRFAVFKMNQTYMVRLRMPPKQRGAVGFACLLEDADQGLWQVMFLIPTPDRCEGEPDWWRKCPPEVGPDSLRFRFDHPRTLPQELLADYSVSVLTGDQLKNAV